MPSEILNGQLMNKKTLILTFKKLSILVKWRDACQLKHSDQLFLQKAKDPIESKKTENSSTKNSM